MSTELIRSICRILIGKMPTNVEVFSALEPPQPVDGQGLIFVCVHDDGAWTIGKGTQQHRRVQLDIHADLTRDDEGSPIADDADRRAWAVYELVNDVLHDVDHALKNSDSRIHHSSRAWGPELTYLPQGDGAIKLSVSYEVMSD